MDKENTISSDAGKGRCIADSVLEFLARRHPDDEQALDSLITLLAGGIEDEMLMEAVYKGANYERDVAAAREQGRIAGRNEKIELEKQVKAVSVIADDGGVEACNDELPLLRHMRRSVWDD